MSHSKLGLLSRSQLLDKAKELAHHHFKTWNRGEYTDTEWNKIFTNEMMNDGMSPEDAAEVAEEAMETMLTEAPFLADPVMQMASAETKVDCPLCGQPVKDSELSAHLDRHSGVPFRREAPPSDRFTPGGRRPFRGSARPACNARIGESTCTENQGHDGNHRDRTDGFTWSNKTALDQLNIELNRPDAAIDPRANEPTDRYPEAGQKGTEPEDVHYGGIWKHDICALCLKPTKECTCEQDEICGTCGKAHIPEQYYNHNFVKRPKLAGVWKHDTCALCLKPTAECKCEETEKSAAKKKKKECAFCGKKFTPKKKGDVYCCNKCQQSDIGPEEEHTSSADTSDIEASGWHKTLNAPEYSHYTNPSLPGLMLEVTKWGYTLFTQHTDKGFVPVQQGDLDSLDGFLQGLKGKTASQIKTALSMRVQCMECGKKFRTSSMLPTCPKCHGSDIEPDEGIAPRQGADKTAYNNSQYNDFAFEVINLMPEQEQQVGKQESYVQDFAKTDSKIDADRLNDAVGRILQRRHDSRMDEHTYIDVSLLEPGDEEKPSYTGIYEKQSDGSYTLLHDISRLGPRQGDRVRKQFADPAKHLYYTSAERLPRAMEIDAKGHLQKKGARPTTRRQDAEFLMKRLDEANTDWKVGDLIMPYKGDIPTRVKAVTGDILYLENGESMHRSHGRRVASVMRLADSLTNVQTFAPNVRRQLQRQFDRMPDRYSEEPWTFTRKRRERVRRPAPVTQPPTQPEAPKVDFHETPTKLPPRDDMRRHLTEDVKDEIDLDTHGPDEMEKTSDRTIDTAIPNQKPSGAYKHDPFMKTQPIAEDPKMKAAPSWVTSSDARHDIQVAFHAMQNCPECAKNLRHAAIVRLIEHLKQDHKLGDLAHDVANAAFQKIDRFRKRPEAAMASLKKGSEDDIAQAWNALTPRGRCKFLGVSGKPTSILFFRPWDELDEREKGLIMSWLRGRKAASHIASDNWLDFVSEQEEDAMNQFMADPRMQEVARMEGMTMEQLWAESKDEYLKTFNDPLP